MPHISATEHSRAEPLKQKIVGVQLVRVSCGDGVAKKS